MAKKRTFWLSYDLGLKGDYNSLYTWLDKHKAKECGDSIAYFEFTFKDNAREEIKKDLLDNIEFKKTDRIYLIWTDDAMKSQGTFIIGHRKQAPWEGYFSTETEQSIDS